MNAFLTLRSSRTTRKTYKAHELKQTRVYNTARNGFERACLPTGLLRFQLLDRVRLVVELKYDPDVREALEGGVAFIVDPTERERVSNFLSAVNAARAEVRVEQLETVTAAGQEAYETRTAELHLGWQKIILVETGLAGEQLEHHDRQRSYEVMKWSYDHCKQHGYTIDDVDKGTPMGKYMYNINLAIIANMPPPTPPVGSASGPATASGAGCLIATLGVVPALYVVAKRPSSQ